MRRTRLASAMAGSAALHILVAALVYRPAAFPGRDGGPAERAIAAFVVAPTEDAEFPGLRPMDHSPAAEPTGHDLTSLSLLHIKIDVRKIADRTNVLFPFVSPGLALDHFFPGFAQEGRTIFDSSALAPVPERERVHERRLTIPDAALQQLIDRTWSRENRWKTFGAIRRLAGSYGAESGRLADVIKEYQRQNALQPFTDTEDRDPRLWAQLSLAADHVDFISFVRRYASEHPSTRAATECLFLLDTIAQANRDALAVLLDSDPPTQLLLTRTANPRAYQLITDIRRHYRNELKALGLETAEAIDARYDNVRLAILNGILRTTPGGYGATDAHFLIGVIYWREHRPEEALHAWRGIAPDERATYAVAASRIATALRNSRDAAAVNGAGSADGLRREIEQILRNEQGRWFAFSEERLRRFGYRVDTF